MPCLFSKRLSTTLVLFQLSPCFLNGFLVACEGSEGLELRRTVIHAHSRMFRGDMMRKVDDVVVVAHLNSCCNLSINLKLQSAKGEGQLSKPSLYCKLRNEKRILKRG